MANLRTINHPGVEIREYDLSQYSPETAGTTTLIMGYAGKGQDNIPTRVSTKNEFLDYYGVPTNEAERYLYYAVNEVISQAGDCIVAKLPYDNSSKNLYCVNTYSVATSSTLSTAFSPSSAYNASDFSGYTAAHIITGGGVSTVATSVIDSYRTGTTKPSDNTFVIIDKTRTVLEKNILSTSNNEVIGYFPVVVTAANALPHQNMLTLSGFTNDPSTSWMAVSAISTASVTVSSADLAVSLATSSIFDNSLSKTLALRFPAITFNSNGQIDNTYMDDIIVTVVSMRNNPSSNNKIVCTPVESFIGSLDITAKDANGNTNYIGNIINENSSYIEFYGKFSANNIVKSGEMYVVKTQNAGIYGFDSTQTTKTISVSALNTALDTVFDRTSNIDAMSIDIVCDAGISNIAQYLTDVYPAAPSGGIYDPNGVVGTTWAGTATSRLNTNAWRTVLNKYINFCSTTRKDCMAILDGLRPLVLAGNQKIVRQGVSTTVDNDILSNLKNLTGINSNYAAMYIDWFKHIDVFTGASFWLPPSIDANAVYVYTDRTANYWDAPAGLNRGVVYNAIDIAFNPTGPQQDAIYSKSFNYAVNYPYDGIVIEGQKTLQSTASAFDRVNVRRLFLKLERLTYKIAKRYVYEPNNIFTRTRLLDELTPIYEDAKSRGGVYDYKLVCDSSNNTVQSIDNNELRLAVLIKPTKTAEFIICDFYALSTGMSFSEVSI